MNYEKPEIIDLGSIAEHTFFRCDTGTREESEGPPGKDFRDFPLDKHGECSEGHANGGGEEPGFS